ncbi:multiheme c-type cytochrome [Motiliproteus sp.]|uniref:multiheme c-type cytochrome n=1 Tax=Motiliproteus sp. TaxID=1898955 RepID=UPI003BA9F805
MKINITVTRPILRFAFSVVAILLLFAGLTLFLPNPGGDGIDWKTELPFYSMPWTNSSPFYPSEWKTTDGHLVNWRSVPSATFCGECHEKEYKEWASSIHAITGSDLIYESAILQNEFGSTAGGELATEKIRWCDGCHEPLAILAGEGSPLTAVGPNEAIEEGATCILCHTAVEARPLAGNAGLTLNINEIKRYLDPTLIMAAPEQHAKSMQAKRHNPMMGKSEMCGTCHTEIRPERINGDFPLHFQETFDEWRLSEYADRNIQCQDCHMDAEPARYVDALKRGEQPERKMSHRFVGNNYLLTESDLPKQTIVTLRGGWVPGRNELMSGEEWLTDLKKQQGLILDLLKSAADMEVSTGTLESDGALPIDIAITNSGAGHNLPTGPLDQRYLWIELKLTDSQNQVVYHSGWFDWEQGQEDPEAVRYIKRMYNDDGAYNDRHILFDVNRMHYERKPIRPMETDRIGYRVPLGEAASGPLKLEVRLWYRLALQQILENTVEQFPVEAKLLEGTVIPPVVMLETVSEVDPAQVSKVWAGSGVAKGAGHDS